MEKVSQYYNLTGLLHPEALTLRNLLQAGLEDGSVKPLSRHIFDWNQVEKAFRFMANGKHVGKVLIKMKDENIKMNDPKYKGKSIVKNVTRNKVSFDSNKSYIVIGGLGGMGLELCEWLVTKGVRNLIITSRTGIKTNYQSFFIDRIKEQFNTTVTILNHNISDLDQAKELIDQAQVTYPLGGIFHLGMVLRDALFQNQTKEMFEECCRIRIQGTYNLDQITRSSSCPSLDHFVCFSSLVSTFGNSGQSNYGFASSFMDNLCARRKLDGLPGLSIAWGMVGDVGHVAEHLKHVKSIVGTIPQRIHSCFEILEQTLHGNDDYGIVSSCMESNSTVLNTKSGNLLKSTLDILGISIRNIDPKMYTWRPWIGFFDGG